MALRYAQYWGQHLRHDDTLQDAIFLLTTHDVYSCAYCAPILASLHRMGRRLGKRPNLQPPPIGYCKMGHPIYETSTTVKPVCDICPRTLDKA